MEPPSKRRIIDDAALRADGITRTVVQKVREQSPNRNEG